MPPECSACVAEPAGTAPRPAVMTPHEIAPQRRTKVAHYRRWLGGGDKSGGTIFERRSPAPHDKDGHRPRIRHGAGMGRSVTRRFWGRG